MSTLPGDKTTTIHNKSATYVQRSQMPTDNFTSSDNMPGIVRANTTPKGETAYT
jgi:hypothetical protein